MASAMGCSDCASTAATRANFGLCVDDGILASGNRRRNIRTGRRNVAAIAIENRQRNRNIGDQRPVAGFAELAHPQADRWVKTPVCPLALKPRFGDTLLGLRAADVERRQRVNRDWRTP